MEAPFAGKVFDVKLIPEFDGSSQPVLEWLEKLELVCELCGIVDIARVLPLRLTGGALAVYQQLANEDRKDVGRIKEALTAAFAVDRFAAHRQFASRRLNMGESPDVFLADLRRLGTLAGGVSESFLGCAFVAGLPEYIQDLLRAGARMEEHTLNQLVGAGLVNEISTCEKNDGLAAGAAEASLRIAVESLRYSVMPAAERITSLENAQRGTVSWRKQQIHVTTVSGGQLHCIGVGSVKLQLSEGDPVTIEGVIADKKPPGFDVIIGMNGISALGGVTVNVQGQVQFGTAKAVVVASAAASIRVDEKDFVATYDPATNTWTTAWKWANDAAPEVLRNTKEEFPLPEGIREAYTEELEQWIQNGWLIPYDESKFGPAKALIPLMAVIQRSKDVTQFRGKAYLSLIDCGPSRFAIWRPLKYHTSDDICEQLESIFCERGAPDELLADNDTAFRSQIFTKLVERWKLRLRFRCAYAPSGNGIIERCHRSVKVIAARKGCAVCEAVYWYNLMPRDDCSEATAPANAIYRYPVRVRGVDSVVHEVQDVRSPYVIGDEVWIKEPGRKCYSQFGRGIVTKVLSGQAVEVDGTPRHIKDIRRQTTLHPERQSEPETCRHESEEEMLLYLPERNQKRHGIRCHVVYGEKLSAESFREELRKFLDEGGHDFVYNADETGLNWKALPAESLIARSEENASGLPLYLIGKAKNPRRFRGVKSRPVAYGHQKKAWMNVHLFKDWMKKEFIPEVKRYQEAIGKTGKVLLLIDNAPAYPVVDLLNSVDELVTVKILPSERYLIDPADGPRCDPKLQGLIPEEPSPGAFNQ
ncbi:hypothetical protein M513_10093 [Trichuris suis]|uniref:Integrase catalytic domain-containing protein n=2 Tax=Trichuris suis TaxID=68888 RepID=A0A085LVP9_9BILA|nr:hypothetical protein M513_10093 [Trichuris suis]